VGAREVERHAVELLLTHLTPLHHGAGDGASPRRAHSDLRNNNDETWVAYAYRREVRVPVRDTGTRIKYRYAIPVRVSYAYGVKLLRVRVSRTRTINLIVKFCTPG
jgi:hypothetical protein